MKPSVLIVDSGMKSVGGHNFSYTRSVQRALESRGYCSDVLVHESFPVDLSAKYGYDRTFSTGAYDFPPGDGWWSDLSYIYARGAAFARQLETAFDRADREYTIVFSHTLADFELIGWRRFVQRRPLSGHLVLLMRNTPRFRTANRMKLMLHPYWRIKPHYLNEIRRRLGERFLLTTDSVALSEDYASVYRHPIVTLPIPLHDAILSSTYPASGIANRYDLQRHDLLRIGYLGDARPSKGFTLLPDVIRRVIADGAAIRFVIQCPAAASGSGVEAADGVAELRALQAQSPNTVTLVEERLSEEDYAALLRSVDVVLIPYRREGYIEPTSGIFAEALASAKPVVVPRGTWMSRELEHAGAGREFESDDVVDLAANVIAIGRQFDAYRRKAEESAAAWRRFHNAGQLVHQLLNHLGLDASAARDAAALASLGVSA